MVRDYNGIVKALMGEINKPDPFRANEVPVDRGFLAPLATYADGQTELAWPAFPVGAVIDGVRRFGSMGFDTPEAIQHNAGAAFDAAGGAVMGGLGVGLAGGLADNSVGIFGGRLAKTADHNALARAEKLAAEGAPREQIWNDTGWFQGVDGKWRFEIDDFNANLKGTTKDYADSGESIPLSEFYNHADLYSAYPHLADTRFAVTSQFKPGEGFYGTQTVDGNVREIIATGYKDGRVGQSDLGAVDVLPHELQHAIQSAEDFAQGGNLGKVDKAIRQRLIDEKMRVMAPIAEAQGIPLDAMRKVVAKEIDGPVGKNDAYRRLAGEAEARAAAKRQSLMADERQARPPWLDYDVPEADQIVRFGSGVSANAPTGSAIPLSGEAQDNTDPALLEYLRAIGLY